MDLFYIILFARYTIFILWACLRQVVAFSVVETRKNTKFQLNISKIMPARPKNSDICK